MTYTIFNSPIVRHLFRWMSLVILHMTGWKTGGKTPQSKKYVLVAAHHTSNWDLLYTILTAFSLNINLYWLGKDTLFKKPLAGPLMRWLGGIPVDRKKSTNVVDQIVQKFNQNKELVITISPAGTRSKIKKWRSGFYHIAKNAGIPIVLGYVDYSRKIGGVGPEVYLTGNYDQDMEKIKSFYKDKKGKHSEKQFT